MSLIIENNFLGNIITNTKVLIGHYIVNRTGFFENGQPKSELNFDDFYIKIKELEDFKDAINNIPNYILSIS